MELIMPPNWANLLVQNRCRAVGVPWSDAEMYAIYTLKIPADVVRTGVVTLDVYEAYKGRAEARTETPIRYMKRDALLQRAKELKIPLTEEDSMTRADLMEVIQDSQTTVD